MQVILATANTTTLRKLADYAKTHSTAIASLLGEEVEFLTAGYANDIGKLAPKCDALKLIIFDTSQHQKQEKNRRGFGRGGLARVFALAHANSGSNAGGKSGGKASDKINVAVMGYASHVEEMKEAIALGAVGYVPVEFGEASFFAALMLMVEGNVFIPAPPHALRQKSSAQPPLILTRRERDVLRCLAHGKADKDIAETYGIAIVTVKHHLKSLRAKLKAKNRVHALARAIELGLADQFTGGDK